MGTRGHSPEVNSKRLEKCAMPDMGCSLCQYGLIEELGYNNHRTFCLLKDEYIVKPYTAS